MWYSFHTAHKHIRVTAATCYTVYTHMQKAICMQSEARGYEAAVPTGTADVFTLQTMPSRDKAWLLLWSSVSTRDFQTISSY